ncbi:hypothetical protein RV08_GL001479 [Enterococcus mundtii]|nr:hypothetical protein RV08_GL001479 [Enterococcus mundtii]
MIFSLDFSPFNHFFMNLCFQVIERWSFRSTVLGRALTIFYSKKTTISFNATY